MKKPKTKPASRKVAAEKTSDLMARAVARSEEIRSAENRAAKAAKSAASAKHQLALAELVIDSLKAQIDRDRGDFRIPVAKRSPAKGTFVRLIIPDTHGAHVDKAAAGAMLADIEHLHPREVIWLGDHLDCGGFLAQHHTIGFVAETATTFEDDVAATNVLLDEVAARVSDAKQDYLEGNHEVRIEKFCVTMALRSGADAEFLRKRIGPEAVLHLQKRGVQYRREAEYHDGLSIRGTIKRGRCYFTHGVSHGQNAARKHLAAFGGNVVFGHVHRELSASDEQVDRGQIRAWCPGCLCTRRPYYHHTRPSGWTHGYAIQLVRDGGFLHINVPIIDGKSYLVQLTERLQ